MSTTEAQAQARESVEGSRLLKELAERVGATARASAVFGEPVERGGITVIPVARARWGFGGGGGTHEGEGGSGGGGGSILDPVGFIELRDGEATFRRLRDPLKPAALIAAIAAAVLLVWRRGGRAS